MNKTFHGWYSELMAQWCGTYLYRDAKGDPIEVTVTHHSKEKGEKAIMWSDLRYIGEVFCPATRAKEPTHGF